MKFLIVVLLLSLSTVYSTESKPDQNVEKKKSVQSVLKDSKQNRKKKVDMCHDCGKPEVNCDCEGEEHKKDE